MDRLTTVTDPLGYQTVYGYDADGNEVSVKDPMGRITTTQYRRPGPPRGRHRPDGQSTSPRPTTPRARS